MNMLQSVLHALCLSQYAFSDLTAPYRLQGCKNGPAPFPGRMSYKATVCHILACFYCVVVY